MMMSHLLNMLVMMQVSLTSQVMMVPSSISKVTPPGPAEHPRADRACQILIIIILLLHGPVTGRSPALHPLM